MKQVVVEVREQGETVMTHFFTEPEVDSIKNLAMKGYARTVMADGKERVFKPRSGQTMVVSLSQR